VSRHPDGTVFVPSTISRELWPGRTVVARGLPFIVLAVQGEVAWIWRTQDDRDTILRIDSASRVRLYSGEKKRLSLDRRGYVRVFLGLGHKLANTGGWQYAHRLAMVPILRRLPTTQEVVAYRNRHREKDGPLDCCPANLQKVTPSRAAELRAVGQRRKPPGAPDGGRFDTGYLIPAAPPTTDLQRALWS
jgi:hypothetical protein